MFSTLNLRVFFFSAALTIGGIVLCVYGIRETLQSDTAPTVRQVDSATIGADRKWLTLTDGVLPTNFGVLEPAPARRGATGDEVIVLVPLVPSEWKPADPVTTFAEFGPFPRSQVARWLEDNGDGKPRSVTGVLHTDQAIHYDTRLKLGQPWSLLRVTDQRPEQSELGAIVTGGLVTLVGLAMGFLLVPLRRRWAKKPG